MERMNSLPRTILDSEMRHLQDALDSVNIAIAHACAHETLGALLIGAASMRLCSGRTEDAKKEQSGRTFSIQHGPEQNGGSNR